MGLCINGGINGTGIRMLCFLSIALNINITFVITKKTLDPTKQVSACESIATYILLNYYDYI